MFNKNFEKVVYSACEALVTESAGKVDQHLADRSAKFVVGQHRLLPPILSFGLRFISVYLNLSCLLVRRKLYTKCSIPERLEIYNDWLASKLFVKKNFMRLIGSLALVSLYESPEVMERLRVSADDYQQMTNFYYG